MSDSFQYVSSAVNFANGRGLSYFIGSSNLSPLNHYPPFYSIVLSAFEFLEIDTITGARWLNAALLGLNVFLVGVSIKMITSSIALSWLGALIVGLSPAVLGVHSWLLSEPLYLVLGTASILALGGYFAYKNSNPDAVWRAIGLLVLPATLAGLALITRFVGLSLIAMGFIGLLIIPHGSLRRKLLRAFIWSVASIIPMAFWSARNYLVTGAYTDRMIGWNALTAKNIGVLVNTVLTWWLPDSIVGGRERYLVILGLIVLISLVSIFYMIWRKSGRELKSGSRQLPASLPPQTLLHSLYLLTYLGIIFVARTLLEPGMGMSDRMLIPLYISGVIVLFDLLHRMLSMKNRFTRIVVIILCSYLLLYNSIAAFQTVISSHETGFGVSKKKWHEF